MSYIAIVGSRNINSDTASFVRAYVDGIADDIDAGERHVVLSGGAMGVDKVVQQAAKDRNVPFMLYAANWHLYGKMAGPVRNAEMVKAAELVVAFWDGTSKGTRNAIEQALKQCRRLEVYFPDDAARTD